MENSINLLNLILDVLFAENVFHAFSELVSSFIKCLKLIIILILEGVHLFELIKDFLLLVILVFLHNL